MRSYPVRGNVGGRGSQADVVWTLCNMLERHAGASLISRRGAKGGRLGIGLSAGITIQTRRPSYGRGQR